MTTNAKLIHGVWRTSKLGKVFEFFERNPDEELTMQVLHETVRKVTAGEVIRA